MVLVATGWVAKVLSTPATLSAEEGSHESPKPGLTNICSQSCFGLSCDPSSAESVAGVLNTFATQPVATRTMGERGRQRVIDEWNYERQFRPVLDLLSRSGRNASDSVAQTQAGWK